MLPFVFEWHWDVGHIVFMGLFYLALTVLVVGLKYCFVATMKDVAIGKTYHHDHGDDHGDHADEVETEELPPPPGYKPSNLGFGRMRAGA